MDPGTITTGQLAAAAILTVSDLPGGGSPAAGWTPLRPPPPWETSLPGVFAAGDLRHGPVKRVASAVGEGSISVSFVHRALSEFAERQPDSSGLIPQ